MRKAAQIRWPRAPEYASITDGGDETGSAWYQGKECAAGGSQERRRRGVQDAPPTPTPTLELKLAVMVKTAGATRLRSLHLLFSTWLLTHRRSSQRPGATSGTTVCAFSSPTWSTMPLNCRGRPQLSPRCASSARRGVTMLVTRWTCPKPVG